ncbi:MAG: DNA polymerase III subunit gamma/tau [Elioraea sp.]|nr:DNA polymerase III subunit gamma/tau [Elioraea sp.]
MSDLFGTPADPPQTDPATPSLFGESALSAAAEQGPPSAPAHYRVLARKYRPQSFEALIGQEALVRTLTNAFASGRIAHAYMLTGVRGVGKTTTARIIARALNCTGPDGLRTTPTISPCGVCEACRAIAEDRHPDVLEIDAASHTGVQNVRETVIEGARYAPLSARYKVYIVDEVHMLSTAAFNALLKTLEEPPPRVVFIFATTEIRKVPVTVLSRCQRFDLRRIPATTLAAHYAEIAAREGVVADPEALALIARAADGSVRDGLSLLDQAIALAGDGPVTAEAVRGMLGLADRAQVWDLFETLMAGRVAEALDRLAEAHAAGADPGVVLQDLLAVTHAVTRAKAVGSAAAATTEEERVRAPRLAERLSLPVLARAWQMLLKGLAETNEATDRLAAAEMVLIRLAHVADLPTPGDLVRRLVGESSPAVAAPAPTPPASSRPPVGGAPRAVGGWAAAAVAVQAKAAAPASPSPRSLADIAALASERGELRLASSIRAFVRPVRIADGLLEFRPEADAPRDLAPRLAAFLTEATGRRWTVAVSAEPGAPTLVERDRTRQEALRARVARHPLVRAILDAFPGASIAAVREASAMPAQARDVEGRDAEAADVVFDDAFEPEDQA